MLKVWSLSLSFWVEVVPYWNVNTKAVALKGGMIGVEVVPYWNVNL